MNKKLCRRNWLAFFSACCFLTGIHTTGLSQGNDFVASYMAPSDFKNYTILPVTGADEYVMAGTIWDKQRLPSPASAVHFMHVDKNGDPVSPPTIALYDPSAELHTAGMADMGDGNYIIAALKRDYPLTSGSLDKIELIVVDANGMPVNTFQIVSNTSLNGGYNNIYPMQVVFQNGLVYVCGYVTNMSPTGASTPSFTPSTSNNRKAFVMKFDPNTMSVLTQYYDFQFTTPADNPDYDMAVSMTFISSNGGTILYVTGGANAIQPTGPTTAYRVSGTLNLELNPSTLTVLNTTKSFVGNQMFSDKYYECGTALIPDPVTNGYFVVSNGGTNDLSSYARYNSPTMVLTYLTYIDPSFNPVTNPAAQSRLVIEKGISSMLAMPSANSNSSAVLGGMQVTDFCNGTGNGSAPGIDNYNPFLGDISLSWDPVTLSLSGNINSWNTYYSYLGTGNHTLSNSYDQLGGLFSNNAWGSAFATRRPIGTGDDITMIAPIWDQDYQQHLNFKMIHTDAYGNSPFCPNSNTCLPPSVNSGQVTAYTLYPVPVAVTYSNGAYSAMATSINPPLIFPIEINEIRRCDVNNPIKDFRTAPTVVSSATNITVAGMTLAPNPATDKVQVTLTGVDAEAPVKIELADITGKTIGILFEGKAAALSNVQLQLPAVAAGIYLVKTSAGNEILSPQKIVIK